MRRDLQLLPVNELFPTIQGEGTWTGTPATFVRLQGCPVGCPWCDTKYTWPIEGADERPLSSILAKDAATSSTFASISVPVLVAAVKQNPERHVVLTGGEPCLYDLGSLSAALLEEGFSVQVETSGTHPVRIDSRAWVTVSPKIDMPGGFPVLPAALRRADEIKHPVGTRRDVQRLLDLLADAELDPVPPIYLQPLSGSPKATALCIEAARHKGWRVSIQVHRFIGVR